MGGKSNTTGEPQKQIFIQITKLLELLKKTMQVCGIAVLKL